MTSCFTVFPLVVVRLFTTLLLATKLMTTCKHSVPGTILKYDKVTLLTQHTLTPEQMVTGSAGPTLTFVYTTKMHVA